MKTLITTLNSKYIHKSLSLRLLYVATKDYHDVDFVEYTIKEDLDKITADIIARKVQIVAFSVYIWNVELIKELCIKLKNINQNLIIIFGGPEVSYEIDYFLDNYEIDYLISGEGEIAFKQLLDCLENKKGISIQGVSSRNNRDYHQTVPVDLKYLESLDSPYLLKRDLADISKRVLYFETSRGCPYQCQYCLSSLEKGLRFFSLDYLKRQLELLMATDVKIIKLLDRSFNAKTEHALAILEFIFQHYRPGIQFQFEINGDVLDQRIINYINKSAPEGLLRFEIGIQSTYEPTNEIVKRYQDFTRLSEVIKQLQTNHKIDFHLDLIAGLPLENLDRFAKSFDDVFSFYPKELQLGFLKLLRGTSLRKDAEKYGYIYDKNPPYELVASNDLTKEDINKIHIVEDMLEKYWNSGKMPITMNKVMRQIDSPFYFFLDLGNYYKKQNYKHINYQNDELFKYLNSYFNGEYLNDLIEDYLRLTKVKPKRWWKTTLNKETSRKIMHKLIKEYDLNQEDLFRYSIIEELDDYYLVATYKNYQAVINKYPKI
ncbi:MAG: DUF4080 domain-containing protein [Thomasclavelia sp.]|uniref:B12-binding domain-containing radical SAM protein n=1 Tax=Thomasclavelia sp. TaxID=3025757 RepID=UPI0039A36F56